MDPNSHSQSHSHPHPHPHSESHSHSFPFQPQPQSNPSIDTAAVAADSRSGLGPPGSGFGSIPQPRSSFSSSHSHTSFNNDSSPTPLIPIISSVGVPLSNRFTSLNAPLPPMNSYPSASAAAIGHGRSNSPHNSSTSQPYESPTDSYSSFHPFHTFNPNDIHLNSHNSMSSVNRHLHSVQPSPYGPNAKFPEFPSSMGGISSHPISHLPPQHQSNRHHPSSGHPFISSTVTGYPYSSSSFSTPAYCGQSRSFPSLFS